MTNELKNYLENIYNELNAIYEGRATNDDGEQTTFYDYFDDPLDYEYTIGADRIAAWKCIDKYSNVARYEITISRDGIAYRTEKAARTTWKKKFMEA